MKHYRLTIAVRSDGSAAIEAKTPARIWRWKADNAKDARWLIEKAAQTLADAVVEAVLDFSQE